MTKRIEDRPRQMFVDDATRNAIIFVSAAIRLATLPMWLLKQTEENKREEDQKPD